MSLRWLLRVECNRCGRLSEGREASGPGTPYGSTLQALRLRLESEGWTCHTPSGPAGHRDLCPNCSEGRP